MGRREMMVRVRLFASLRDAAECDECSLTLAPGARGVEVRQAVAARYPRMRELLETTRMARNLEYASWNCPLADGDEVSLIPPVSGG